MIALPVDQHGTSVRLSISLQMLLIPGDHIHDEAIVFTD